MATNNYARWFASTTAGATLAAVGSFFDQSTTEDEYRRTVARLERTNYRDDQ